MVIPQRRETSLDMTAMKLVFNRTVPCPSYNFPGTDAGAVASLNFLKCS